MELYAYDKGGSRLTIRSIPNLVALIRPCPIRPLHGSSIRPSVFLERTLPMPWLENFPDLFFLINFTPLAAGRTLTAISAQVRHR